jgi:hypothetical protein
MDSNQLVHTTGINWEGLLTTCAVVSGVVGGFVAFTWRALKGFIRSQVKELVEQLKDLKGAVQEQDGKLDDARERLSAIEGRSYQRRRNDNKT